MIVIAPHVSFQYIKENKRGGQLSIFEVIANNPVCAGIYKTLPSTQYFTEH